MIRKLLLLVLLFGLTLSGCAISTETKGRLFNKQYETKAGLSIDGER